MESCSVRGCSVILHARAVRCRARCRDPFSFSMRTRGNGFTLTLLVALLLTRGNGSGSTGVSDLAGDPSILHHRFPQPPMEVRTTDFAIPPDQLTQKRTSMEIAGDRTISNGSLLVGPPAFRMSEGRNHGSRRRLLSASDWLPGASRRKRGTHYASAGDLRKAIDSKRLEVVDLNPNPPPSILSRKGRRALKADTSRRKFATCAKALLCPEFRMCEDAGFEDISVCRNPDYMDLAPRLAANGTTTKPEENDEYGGVEEEEEEEEEEGGEVGEEGDEVEGEEGGGGKAAKGGSAVAMVWSGRVFALHDVYVNNKGQVFNATHVFNPNGCYAEDKFHYEAGTRVSSYNSLVNLLVIGGTPGARVPFHEVLELVPLFLPLSRVLKKHGKPALVMRGKKLPRVVGITMGRMLSFGDAARLLFVRTLIQPTFQHCQHPSPSLWSKLRSSHFLQPRGLPLLNPDWSERLPPSSPKTRSPPAAIPPWETSGVKEVIVLEPPAAVQVKGFAGIVAGLKGRFGAEHVRLVGRFQRDDARDLFPRAALLVSVTSPFLVNLAFLPPRAALLELRPPPAEVDAVIADSVASLAAACQIHHRVIRGSFVEGAAGGGRGKGAEEGAGKGVVEWRSGAVEAAAMFLARVVGKALTADEKVVEEAVLTAADRRMRAAQLAQASTSKQPLIPGTQIQSLPSAARFRRWLRCVSQRGRWAYNATPRILPWEYLGTMNLCDHRHQETTGGLVTKKADKYVMEGGASGGWSVRESLKYEWRTPPGKCPIGPLRQFDGDTFCRKAEGRKGGLNLVFLGDSLAHQMVVSFLNGLLRHIPKPAVWAVNETIPQECSDWLVEPPRHAYCRVYTFNESVCPGLKVQFVRNDHLWFTSPGEAKFDHIPWHLYSGLNDAHVVVVNRGAHFIGGKDFERSVPAALSFLRKKLPDALIIWRNTPPGHANCTTYIGPIKKRQNPEILPFHWDMFTRQNKLVRGMMHEMGAVYMDVDTATALRPDSHKGFVEERGILDCLHYCTPGPTDMWVELLADIILRGVYGDGLAPLGVT